MFFVAHCVLVGTNADVTSGAVANGLAPVLLPYEAKRVQLPPQSVVIYTISES